MTAETIIQSLASGLLMGLLYGLIAVGLALIFGLMDVVNFAHGEFLMIAMYATFFLFVFFAIDPLLAAPLVAAALFVFGALAYLLIVRFAVRAKANAGMVQIFSTFGLAIVMRGVAQFFFTPDYRSVTHSWLGGKTVSVAGIFLPVLRKEERELAARFPKAYGRYLKQVPPLWPKFGAVGTALRTSGFTFERAGRNFGLRALWFLLLVPALSAALSWLIHR